MNYKDIPIIITGRDRVTPMRNLIEWLLEAGQKNITVIDNYSSYPPLLDFYETAGNKFKVKRLAINLGSRGLWDERNEDLRTAPLVLTDPDIFPIEECPLNAIEFLQYLAYEHFPHVPKVGFGLKIDDLPDHYALKPVVEVWERQFWEAPFPELINGVQCYDASVDTTFALYSDVSQITWAGVRTGFPFVARHVDWYRDSANPTDEQLYYESHVEVCHSWGLETCYFKPAIEKYEKEQNAEQQPDMSREDD
jgi:hypothetical protein